MKTVAPFKVLITLLAITCMNPPASSPAKEVKTGDLTLNVPETWTQQKSTSLMRIAQFAVPPAEGDREGGEYVVFYFGADQGGTVEDNINRWIGQFEEKGREVKRETGDSANGKFTSLVITGTYKKPVGAPMMGKSQPAPGFRMLAAVIETAKGNYFIKFTGPDKTVNAAAEDFKKSFGVK